MALSFYFLPNLVISGAYYVKVVDKAIIMDNLRLIMSSSKRLQRDRATTTVYIPSRLINSRFNVQYLPSYRFDQKSYMSFRLVQISVTLNDLERQNGAYFALFHRLRLRCRRKTIVRLTSVSKSAFDS